MAGKVIEVDETAFLASQNVVKTVQAMLGNPKSRKMLQQAQKVVMPDVPIPELDAAAPINEAVEAVRNEFQTYVKEERERRQKEDEDRRLDGLRTRYESGRAKLRSQGYLDDAIEKIEALMLEKGIVDHEDAQIIFERRNPPPAPPVQPSSGGWNFFDQSSSGQAENDEYVKSLMATRGQDEGALHRMTQAALSEVRGQGGSRR